jgi:hypothetical protein
MATGIGNIMKKKSKKDFTMEAFAYFINELKNSGVLTPKNIDKMLSCMEQHNTKPWGKKDIYNILCDAYNIVLHRNLA